MPYQGIVKRKARKLSDIDQYEELASRLGIEPPKEKKSLFRKTIDILSRGNYASAGFFGALTKRGQQAGENPLQEAWEGLLGKEKETFSDVLGDMGVENKWAKGIAGFALDVALDPTTYIGGSLIRGGLKVTGKVAKPVVNLAEKISPRRVTAIKETFSSIGDALGKAFVPAHGTTKTVKQLTLGSGEVAEQALGKFTIKGSKVVDDSGRQVGILDNGVIKDLKGKKQIGSVDSVVGQVNGFQAKSAVEMEEFIGKNEGLFKGFTGKELEQAADIMINNRGVTRGLKGFEGKNLIQPAGKLTGAVSLMKTKGQELAEFAGIKGEEWYFPFLDKNKLGTMKKYSDVLESSGKDYLKKLEGKVPTKDLLRKPIEAYSRREYEIMHDVLRAEVKDDLVKAFGKNAGDFNNLADAVKAGYRPIVRGKSFAVAEAASKAGKAVDPDDVLGYLKEADFKFVNQILYPEMKTVDMLAKASGFDAFTGMFKSLVTAWFPAFHIRNMVSGVVQNYSALGRHAFNPATFREGVALTSEKFLKNTGEKVVNWGGTKTTRNTVRKGLVDRFQYSSRYMTDVENVTDVVEGAMKFKNLKKMNPRRVGNWIEFNQKSGATVAAMKQGKSLEEALNLAEKAGFDYSKITQFESKVMKRLMPFYTFARKNAALQASTFIKHPERLLNQVKFTNLLSNVFGGNKPTEEELSGLPPWALDALGFKIGGDRVISKFGFPMEEFLERIADPIQTSLTSANPLIKFPLEAKTGFDFFRDKPIQDIKGIKEPTAKLLMHEKTPKWLKEAFSVNSWTDDSGKEHFTADPESLHLLRNLPISRFINTFDKLFEDGITEVNPEKAASFVIGAQLYDIDIELQKHFLERDLMSYYQKEFTDKGVAWEWNQVFTREE